MPTKQEILEFSLMIEDLTGELKCSHIDAIVHYCEKTGMEIESASSLVSSALKAKIAEEAEELNLLKKSSKLPI